MRKSHQSCWVKPGRWHRCPALRNTVRRLAIFCLPVVLNGCAVHYGNARKGVETAWGIGRTTWEVEQLTNGWSTVSSGTRLPGLVVGIGPDFFGLSFGYQVRERLQITATADLETIGARINGNKLDADVGKRWGIGQIRLRTPLTSSVAVVSGKAGAGLGLALENGLPSVFGGWQSRQLTTVGGADVFIELRGGSPEWPYFDFPSTLVAVAADTNQTEKSIAP